MVLGASPSGPRLTHKGRSGPGRWTVAVALGACLVGGGAEAQDDGREAHDSRLAHHGGYVVRASHLVKFPTFVLWPDTAFEAPASPFRLCIAGGDPFGPLIDRLAQGARVGEHPMTVMRTPVVAKGADCHVLFVAASRVQTPREMLAAVAGRPVLTVADEGLDAPGAMIQFVTIQGRMRFDIRSDAAQTEGLTVSSKLLSLAAPRGSGSR